MESTGSLIALTLETMMARELTDDEADAVMANIRPEHRRWCAAGWGLLPGETTAGYPKWFVPGSGCGCMGCVYGALSGEDFLAWQEREAKREPTPYIPDRDGDAPALEARLRRYKARKG